MTRGIAGPITAALAGAALLVFAPVPRAYAEAGPAPDAAFAMTAPDSASPPQMQPLAVTADSVAHAPFSLMRAALEHSSGNPRGVLACLEPLHLESAAPFEGADRAAFLLAHAYLELGSVARFQTLARAVEAWPQASGYTRWIVYRLRETELATVSPDPRGVSPASPSGSIAADALAASLLIENGKNDAALALLAQNKAASPLLLYLATVAKERSGADVTADLEALAGSDTVTALGRELAALARLRLATRAAAAQQDPVPMLEQVPDGTRFTSVARHMLGQALLERGESARGRAVLGQVLAADSTYAGRREADLALAGDDLEHARWMDSWTRYQAIDRDWSARRATIDDGLASEQFDPWWQLWERDAARPDAIVLDAVRGDSLNVAVAQDAARWGATTPADVPAPEAPAWTGGVPSPPASLSPADQREASASGRALTEAREALARAREDATAERARLDDRLRYLGGGRDQLGRSRLSLLAASVRLDSLRRTLDSLDARIRSVRDRSIAHVLDRARGLLAECELNRIWIAGMEHLHVHGPDSLRMVAAPAGYAGPDSVLERETAMIDSLAALVGRITLVAPGWIARSYRDAWRPGLLDRAARQAIEAHDALNWVARIQSGVDSNVTQAQSSPEWRRRVAAIAPRERALDSIWTADRARRDRIARATLEAARTALDREREAIDYGLAVASYGLSVRLAASVAGDSGAAAGAASDTLTLAHVQAAADSAQRVDAGEEFDDPEATRWRTESIQRMSAFLAQHPGSPARADMRFRLADLEIIAARQEFRQKMAHYLKAQSEGRDPGGALPVMTHDRALTLYRAMLAEDRSFPHLDAVLFNAGMLLADDGDPEAQAFFAKLVEAYPASSYCQEAYLRLGDMPFNEKRFADCIPYYQRAASGPDISLQVIALYKLGWAQFNQDQFVPAAEAFRGVMDLYATGRRVEIHADIEREAESYLVHSLAGAGGAPAFATFFDATHHRAYEERVLMALGQHFRRYGLFAEAVETDQLFLDRFPLQAEALTSAQRLIETRARSERPVQAREARLTYAPRFGPGSPWAKAQPSDSLREAGSAFARDAWMAVAFEYHRAAREGGARTDWKQALTAYRTILSTWPADSGRATLELNAGEASAQLGEFPDALGHYRAAETGRDSVASQALWQQVAVTDAWYEKTRPSTPPAAARRDSASRPAVATGTDSLARAVITAADRLLQRFPDHPRGADLVWRQAQLEVAHGWNDSAAVTLGRLSRQFPDDARAPLAARLRADAIYRTNDFEAAGAAYEEALVVAQRAGRDTLAREIARAIPVCYLRSAEAAVAADSTRYEQHAQRFERVATRWPDFEYAHVAQYRAGLAWMKAGHSRDAVLAMQSLIQKFPKSEYVREAHLQIARIWENDKQPEKSAAAYAEFAARFPDDESAGAATLKAADLYVAAGMVPEAEALRLGYIRKHPDDVETAMEILEGLARRDLAGVNAQHPISTLMPKPAPKMAKATKAAKVAQALAPPSHLADYLARAKQHPELASKAILAEVRFLEAEEAYVAYANARLRQPLPKSIAAKQKLLDKVVGLYRQSVDYGVAEWAHASTYRIGAALVAFGEALEHSERPADIHGDDLTAYEDVLFEQSGQFYGRGEDVWTELLRQRDRSGTKDEWLAKAEAALWPRLATRFYFKPEAEFPLVEAATPPRPRSESDSRDRNRKAARTGSDSSRALADGEDHDR